MGHNATNTGGSDTAQLSASIKTVRNLFEDAPLTIPSYQRPYTWTTKNVSQLVSDIRRFENSGQYRIGTFILHPSQDPESDSVSNHIVDGQQRYLSFALILIALAEHSKTDEDLAEDLQKCADDINLPDRWDDQSDDRLRENYSYLEQLISRWTAEELSSFTKFFLDECSVVVLKVRDLDSAFQMFDSQNTRGLGLFPTDLLKAYHLREFEQTKPSKAQLLDTVRSWEAIPAAEINHLLSGVLFPIMKWARNEPVPRTGFTSDYIDLFKGVSASRNYGRFRWAHSILMAKETVDNFNVTHSSLIDHGTVEALEFPFQISQPIIDGEMFFEMVQHYMQQARQAGISVPHEQPSHDRRQLHHEQLQTLLDQLNELPDSTGYRYVRALFDCLLIAYIDRFGWHQVNSAGTILARHAYVLRLALKQIKMESIDKHARMGHPSIPDINENLFASLSIAQDPQFVLSRAEPTILESYTWHDALADLYRKP